VPGLVLFLLLGMAIGSDGTGWIQFDDVELARTIGIIAIVLILFEGGLAAGWGEIRPVLPTALSLAFGGTVVTAVVTGLAAAWLLDLTTLEGLLLGSIVATTDSAAIFSVLRGSTIERRLARTLEAESGMNDPVAFLLVLGFIEWIQEPSYGASDMIAAISVQLAIGAAVGYALGRLAVEAMTRVQFATTGLYPVATIAAAALAYGVADVLGGSGFLAVYMTGLALGSGRIPGRRTVGDFHSGVAWVSQIALFLTLGLLVFPSQLGDIALEGMLIAAVLMFIARPLATFLATRVGAFTARESLLVGWAGLRGAMPVVFATIPIIEGVGHANELFNIVFFVVLLSTLLQGATFEPLARALKLTTDEPALPRPLIEVGRIRRLGAEVVEHAVAEGDTIVGRVVNELGLPREALVSVIVRGEAALLPRGSTVIEAGDRLHVLMQEPVRMEVEALIERWREGEIETQEPVVVKPLGRPAIFTVRPWREEDGDAARPDEINGIPVARAIRARRDQPGSFVQLEDGRYAVVSEGLAAVGGSRQLFRWCRARIATSEGYQGRAWWQEVSGVLSQRAVR